MRRFLYIYIFFFQENTFLWRTSLYLAASASAEFFADIALCPMEAVKVRIQTQPNWSTSLREGAPRIMKEEGLTGLVTSTRLTNCSSFIMTVLKEEFLTLGTVFFGEKLDSAVLQITPVR